MKPVICEFLSETLGRTCKMNVLLPNDPQHCSVLYLLHGRSDTFSAWCDRSEIEEIAERYQIAVVMPDAKNSFYNNMATGERYYDHIVYEIPQIVHRMYRISNDPKKTHIAGLSMGGYGAFLIALRNPNLFCSAGSFSGSLDLYARFRTDSHPCYREVFADCEKIPGSSSDLLTLLETNEPLPHLYQFCGTDDYLYQDNKRFLEKAGSLGVAVEYSESPGGHEWELWREQILRFVPWMLAKETRI